MEIRNTIEYFVMDVDGTLTDGKIYMGSEGECMKAFDIKDGYGIHNILPACGVVPVIITGRTSRILENRCAELNIAELYQGVADKKEKLRELIERKTVTKVEKKYSAVAYIGDDLNDLGVMQEIKAHGGVVACPKDAVDDIKSIADYICPHNGGCGAVRDFIDWMISLKR